MRRYYAISSLVLSLNLAACSVTHTPYQTPAVADVPATWHSQTTAITAHDELTHWWQNFQDPLLNQLIEQTLAHNHDLAIGLANLRQARAERIQLASYLQPSINAVGHAQRSRTSGNLAVGQAQWQNLYQAGLDASWELDIFGAQSFRVQAQEQVIEALVLDQQVLALSLVAEVSQLYFQLRSAQQRLVIAKATQQSLVDSERLAQAAHQQGLSSRLDSLQARTERELHEAKLQEFAEQIDQLEHAISVLTGGFAGAWQQPFASVQPLPKVPRLPAQLPAQVIKQRPDLQAAERRLASAASQVNAAYAECFPQFNVPLGVLTSARTLHQLFEHASLTLAATITGNYSLYDAGRSQAKVTAASARMEAALVSYQRDVRYALKDVEDALVALNSQRQRQHSLRAAVQHSQQAQADALTLYQQGLTSYLPVLTAQRSANQAQDELALSQLQEINSTIALYKALGVGF